MVVLYIASKSLLLIELNFLPLLLWPWIEIWIEWFSSNSLKKSLLEKKWRSLQRSYLWTEKKTVEKRISVPPILLPLSSEWKSWRFSPSDMIETPKMDQDWSKIRNKQKFAVESEVTCGRQEFSPLCILIGGKVLLNDLLFNGRSTFTIFEIKVFCLHTNALAAEFTSVKFLQTEFMNLAFKYLVDLHNMSRASFHGISTLHSMSLTCFRDSTSNILFTFLSYWRDFIESPTALTFSAFYKRHFLLLKVPEFAVSSSLLTGISAASTHVPHSYASKFSMARPPSHVGFSQIILVSIFKSPWS